MTAPSLTDTEARAGDLRPLRKWARRWRFAAIAAAATSALAGLAWAWNWLSSAQLILLLVVAGPGIGAFLVGLGLSNEGRIRTAEAPAATSDWEARIRPHFPPDERPETKLTHQSQGDEA